MPYIYLRPKISSFISSISYILQYVEDCCKTEFKNVLQNISQLLFVINA